MEGKMNDAYERLVQRHNFFSDERDSATGQLFEEKFREVHVGFGKFELSRVGFNNENFPFTVLLGRFGTKAARFSVINEEPIHTHDPNRVKFLVDITTADGDLYIGMIYADVK